MLSDEKCKKILNKRERKYTDDEVKKLKKRLYEIAQIEKENYRRNNYESGFVHKGLN